MVFVITGSHDRSFTGSFNVAGHTVEVTEAKFLGVKIQDESRVRVIGEGIKGKVIVDEVERESVCP